MTRREVIREAKVILTEAYEIATELIVLYLEDHPHEQLKPLCREIDPDNWNALRQRVQRAQARRKASSQAETTARARETERKRHAHARSVLRTADTDAIEELIETLPPKQIERLARAATEQLPARRAGRDTGPLDMGHLPKAGEARLNRWHIEGKDLWDKYSDELTLNQRRRFIDKHSGWVAKIAARELEHV